MNAHEIQQPINEIDVFVDADGDAVYHKVGRNGVTRIEACAKPGLHCDIPYIRVWKDDMCFAEFCQHSIIGVYFAGEKSDEPVEADPTAAPSYCDLKDTHTYDTCDCLPF